MKSLLKASVLAATLGGCLGSARVGYRATVVAPAPVVVETAPPEPVYVEPTQTVEVEYVEPASYVYINPNVQVIENYEYPVFFSGGLYWRQDGGVWYSSSYHDRGWGTSAEVPMYIRSIDRPTQYVGFHADVHARVGQPGYRYVPPAPIHHAAPPPRYVEQPGHPVGHPMGRPPVETHAGEPAHPMPTRVEPHPDHAPMHADPDHGSPHGEPGRVEPHPAHEPPHGEAMHPAEPTHPAEAMHPTHGEPAHVAPPLAHPVAAPPSHPAPPPHPAPAPPPAKRKK